MQSLSADLRDKIATFDARVQTSKKRVLEEYRSVEESFLTEVPHGDLSQYLSRITIALVNDVKKEEARRVETLQGRVCTSWNIDKVQLQSSFGQAIDKRKFILELSKIATVADFESAKAHIDAATEARKTGTGFERGISRGWERAPSDVRNALQSFQSHVVTSRRKRKRGDERGSILLEADTEPEAATSPSRSPDALRIGIESTEQQPSKRTKVDSTILDVYDPIFSAPSDDDSFADEDDESEIEQGRNTFNMKSQFNENDEANSLCSNSELKVSDISITEDQVHLPTPSSPLSPIDQSLYDPLPSPSLHLEQSPSFAVHIEKPASLSRCQVQLHLLPSRLDQPLSHSQNLDQLRLISQRSKPEQNCEYPEEATLDITVLPKQKVPCEQESFKSTPEKVVIDLTNSHTIPISDVESSQAGEVSSDTSKRDAVQSLAPGQWLNDEAIRLVLEVLSEQHKSWRHVSPLYTSDLQRLENAPLLRISELDDIISFPLNIDRHWMLAILFRKSNRVDFYNSLTSAAYKRQAEIKIQAFLQKMPMREYNMAPADWNVQERACPQQPNGYDCGVFVIVVQLYIMLGLPLPTVVHGRFWRTLFSRLLKDEESTQLSPNDDDLESLINSSTEIPRFDTFSAPETPPGGYKEFLEFQIKQRESTITAIQHYLRRVKQKSDDLYLLSNTSQEAINLLSTVGDGINLALDEARTKVSDYSSIVQNTTNLMASLEKSSDGTCDTRNYNTLKNILQTYSSAKTKHEKRITTLTEHAGRVRNAHEFANNTFTRIQAGKARLGQCIDETEHGLLALGGTV